MSGNSILKEVIDRLRHLKDQTRIAGVRMKSCQYLIFKTSGPVDQFFHYLRIVERPEAKSMRGRQYGQHAIELCTFRPFILVDNSHHANDVYF